jgi:hypothetical protein
MKQLKNHPFLLCLSTFLLSTTGIQAYNEVVYYPANEVVYYPVEQSPVILIEQEPIYQPVIIEQANNAYAANVVPVALPGLGMNSNYYTTMDYQWVSHAAFNGQVLELGDGSQWKVDPSELYRLNSWNQGDAIAITQCHNPFSSYNYYLTNKSKSGFLSSNAYVKVNLHQGPFAFGPNSHWIVGINYDTRQVNLENGSCWNIGHNVEAFYNWQVNDTILIGVNDHPLSFAKSILINVNMNTCVHADRF